jgi:hypothetical protein
MELLGNGMEFLLILVNTQNIDLSSPLSFLRSQLWVTIATVAPSFPFPESEVDMLRHTVALPIFAENY